MGAPSLRSVTNPLTAGRLPRFSPLIILVACWAIAFAVFWIFAAASGTGLNTVGALVAGVLLYTVVVFVVSALVEGRRAAIDRVITTVVSAAFILALIPLASLLITTLLNGSARFDIPFFTETMRNVVGAGGGAFHAIIGTLLITGMATLISVPIGLLAAIYLVEYGRGHLARWITFFVDVMTGIPSIVAGLFAYAFFSLIFDDPGIRFGFGGSVALSVLMIPVVVRSCEEILKLVPLELREASYALGVPKWLTIVKIVLPTSLPGIITGVMISIARIIGETAPLLIIAGFTASLNLNLFSERMATLPVYVYTQYASQGINAQAYLDRAWSGALTLIIIVMMLNLIARIVTRLFSPKLAR